MEAGAIAFAVIFILSVMFLFMMLKNIKWIYMASANSDKRINYIADIVNGIKTIKAYCWEHVLENKVRHYRDLQLSFIK